jgi:hypothetical protein
MSDDFKDRISKIIDDRKKTDNEKKRIKTEHEAAQKIKHEQCYSEWSTCRENIILPAANKLKTILHDQKITLSVELPSHVEVNPSEDKKYYEVKLTLPASYYNNSSLYINFTHLTDSNILRVTSNLHLVTQQKYLDISIAEMTKSRVEELLVDFIKLAIK